MESRFSGSTPFAVDDIAALTTGLTAGVGRTDLDIVIPDPALLLGASLEATAAPLGTTTGLSLGLTGGGRIIRLLTYDPTISAIVDASGGVVFPPQSAWMTTLPLPLPGGTIVRAQIVATVADPATYRLRIWTAPLTGLVSL